MAASYKLVGEEVSLLAFLRVLLANVQGLEVAELLLAQLDAMTRAAKDLAQYY